MKRQKELEEARKAGLAEPELDEDGKPINPHIPQFMASAPWYLNEDKPTLKHQKNWKGKRRRRRHGMTVVPRCFRQPSIERVLVQIVGPCLIRPRIVWRDQGDRWNGYDEREWVKHAQKFEEVQNLRQELRKKELLEKKFQGELEDVDGALRTEEDKFVEEEDAAFGKVKVRAKSAGGGESGTVRNLRIREDTAKYLLNLDVDSAYYDPKSRSMREDPNPEKDPSEKTFAGDNFVKQSGQAQGFQQLNLFSVMGGERGQEVHLQATPSQAEVSFRAVQERKKLLQKNTSKDVLEKYGNVAEKPSEEVKALRGTEAYVEYDASGRVIRGQEIKARSRYEEDVHPGNHTSVWGSWYSDGVWGYACCHQTTRNAYCTGEDGKKARLVTNTGNAVRDEEPPSPTRRNIPVPPHGAEIWGTDSAKDIDEEKLQRAIERQERMERANESNDTKKRQHYSGDEGLDVSAEDMEAYRLKRSRGDDPLMAIEKQKALLKGGSKQEYDFV
eukprot:jgi/Picre1/32833/NNA_008163.t1